MRTILAGFFAAALYCGTLATFFSLMTAPSDRQVTVTVGEPIVIGVEVPGIALETGPAPAIGRKTS